jgi:cytosine/adenosine deaminase-related metal-dependent hydrolase
MNYTGATEILEYVSGSSRTRALWLKGGRVGLDARTAERADVEILNGRIRKLVVRSENNALRHSAESIAIIDLRGYLILPGLINAHDHLEFNLYPRLGRGPYANYKAWAADIYRPKEAPLKEHLAVPEAVRLWWGGVKNLLAGVTTVCHHNPYVSKVFDNGFPVRVVNRFQWSHSLAFGKGLNERHCSAANDVPFIIHLGEGTDAQSAGEIFALQKLGALNSRSVIVHGVALNKAGLSLLDKLDAALVWCPTSNIFILRRTLNLQTVANFRRIALGSDSALTAQGDLLDEIRFAHAQREVTPERIYSLVTDMAADVLRLQNGEGTLRPGACADLIALKDTGQSPAEALTEARPGQIELVLKEGEPNLISSDFSERWTETLAEGFEPLTVQGVRRLVRAPIKWLIGETRNHLGNRFCLAGRRVSL